MATDRNRLGLERDQLEALGLKQQDWTWPLAGREASAPALVSKVEWRRAHVAQDAEMRTRRVHSCAAEPTVGQLE